MFEMFSKTFALDYKEIQPGILMKPNTNDFELLELISRYQGRSFDNGLYRIFSVAELNSWTEMVERAFPQLNGRITTFAVDWLGRIFAIDQNRLEEGRPGVVMCDAGSDSVLQIPCNILTFHNQELIEYTDAALAVNFYHEWLRAGGASPSANQCVGYKKPLFLGGEDAVNNLALSDLEVYWEICAQLIDRTRDVPVGTAIGKIKIS